MLTQLGPFDHITIEKRRNHIPHHEVEHRHITLYEPRCRHMYL